MPLRQGHAAVSHGLGVAVYAGKISSLHPSDQLSPDFRINHPVQIQGIFGIIIKGGSAPHVFKLLRNPAGSFVTVFFIQESAVPLQGLIRPHSQQAHGLFPSVRKSVPAAELFGEILLMHPVAVGSHRIVIQIDYILLIRHGAHPAFLLGIVPGIPVHFIAAERRPGSHGQADPVGLHLIPDPFKRPAPDIPAP